MKSMMMRRMALTGCLCLLSWALLVMFSPTGVQAASATSTTSAAPARASTATTPKTGTKATAPASKKTAQPGRQAGKAAGKTASKAASKTAGKTAGISGKPMDDKARAKGAADEARARAELETVARAHVQKASRTLRPDAAHKQVRKGATGFVASYLVVDDTNVTFEMTVHELPGSKYVGNVAYVVHEYQCIGASEQEALAAPCSRVKSRRMREYTRYEKGKWML